MTEYIFMPHKGVKMPRGQVAISNSLLRKIKLKHFKEI